MTKREIKRLTGLLFQRRLDFTFDGIVFRRTRLTFRQVSNFLLSGIEARRQVRKPLSYPISLQLEPTFACQLSCPLCPRQVINPGPGNGGMAWEHYERLMDEMGPYLLCIAFWRWGEPLLYPRIVDMIARAHRDNILTLVSTNGQVRPDFVDLTQLFQAGLDHLIISMDGATQAVQEHCRSGSDVEAVKCFTRAAVEGKRAVGRGNPIINVRTVMTRGNESEIEDICSFAREAGADFYTGKCVTLYYDASPSNPDLPLRYDLRSSQYRGDEGAAAYREIPNLCRKPWTWPTLCQDGTLLVCECDHAHERVLGNVFTAGSFRSVWRGKANQELRSHFPASGKPDSPFCLRCRYKLDDAIPIVRALKNG